MLLWPTVLLLLTVCCGHLLSDESSAGTNIHVHQASLLQLLKLKCDSLLYRSIVRENACFFAIHEQVSHKDGQDRCESAFPSAKIYSARDFLGALILRDMQLNTADYHSESTRLTGTEKNVLCRYVNPRTCSSDEATDMPGRCMKKYDKNLNFREASKHCRDRDSRLPWINNNEENGAVARLASSSAWIDQAVFEDEWKAAVTEPVQYTRFYGELGPDAKCSESIAATISTAKKGSCVTYSMWETTKWTEKRQVICVRPCDSDFNPHHHEEHPITLPPGLNTSTTTTTTPKPVRADPEPIVKGLPVYPPNGWPKNEWMPSLRFYYNYGRILHCFCASTDGCKQMFNNGIGYEVSSGSGDVGKLISQWGMDQMHTVCSQNYKNLRRLSFVMKGPAWVHNFDGQGIFAGYVATQPGVCGAWRAIKGYSCAVSQDAMYGENLEWNTWYKGRSWGYVAFYLW